MSCETKREFTVYYNILAAIIDVDLFENLAAKIYFSFHNEEMDTDATFLLIQLIKRLSKVLCFNTLEVFNANIIEPCPLLPKVTFYDDLNEFFNSME